MFEQLLERVSIGAYAPLEAWCLVMVLALIPTMLVYLALHGVQANFAGLQGKLGNLGVKLGGPAAFYGVLLFLSTEYVDQQLQAAPTVRLSGEVHSIDRTPIDENVWVAALIHKDQVSDGKFSLRVPYDPDGRYDLIAFSDWGFKRLSDFAADNPDRPDGAVIRDFPDARYTTLIGGPFTDQGENSIGDVEITVSAQVTPLPLHYDNAEEAQIRIEKGTYRISFVRGDQVIWSRDVSNVAPGGTFRLPQQVNLTTLSRR